MSDRAKVDLSTRAVLAVLHVLPDYLQGYPDAELADLGWCGEAGVGLWPIRERTISEGASPLLEADPEGPFVWRTAADASVGADPTKAVVERNGVVSIVAADGPTVAARLTEIAAGIVGTANREAGEQRARYITVTTGQTSTYAEKEEEAKRFLADPSPDLDNYFYIPAEAAETGQAPEEVALLIKATADGWRRVNAKIEAKRRGVAVKAASAVAAKNYAALQALLPIDWEG